MVGCGYEVVDGEFMGAQEGVEAGFVEEACALGLWGDEVEEKEEAEPGVEGDPAGEGLAGCVSVR